MIHINLMNNKLADLWAIMLMAGKYESLGYADNPYEMNCGIRRCKYVKGNWDNYESISTN
jgi:hypothetical protein